MSDSRIRSFADIPDILSLEIPAVEYIVPALGISRNSITLWTGTDGHGIGFRPLRTMPRCQICESGIWNQEQPPKHGNGLLLNIAKEIKPVIVIDPFRYFHTAEENDSTAMSEVMQYLRACAAHGCAVILLHHPAKTEGSTGRGSSVIRGACDLAFLHSLDR